jgi:hypothetical protein
MPTMLLQLLCISAVVLLLSYMSTSHRCTKCTRASYVCTGMSRNSQCSIILPVQVIKTIIYDEIMVVTGLIAAVTTGPVSGALGPLANAGTYPIVSAICSYSPLACTYGYFLAVLARIRYGWHRLISSNIHAEQVHIFWY